MVVPKKKRQRPRRRRGVQSLEESTFSAASAGADHVASVAVKLWRSGVLGIGHIAVKVEVVDGCGGKSKTQLELHGYETTVTDKEERIKKLRRKKEKERSGGGRSERGLGLRWRVDGWILIERERGGGDRERQGKGEPGLGGYPTSCRNKNQSVRINATLFADPPAPLPLCSSFPQHLLSIYFLSPFSFPLFPYSPPHPSPFLNFFSYIYEMGKKRRRRRSIFNV